MFFVSTGRKVTRYIPSNKEESLGDDNMMTPIFGYAFKKEAITGTVIATSPIAESLITKRFFLASISPDYYFRP